MVLLVVDVGTSGVRVALVDTRGRIVASERAELAPSTPADGVVEIDADRLAQTSVVLARDIAGQAGTDRIAGVAITNQRASTIVWDRSSGRALAPGLGWQDLRTVGRCLELRAQDVRLSPNQSATKAEWLLDETDALAADRAIGTVDTFVAWHLSDGAVFATDTSNASVTGMADATSTDWDPGILAALDLDRAALPQIVATVPTEPLGAATVLPGAPPITALVGDQQASLAGQACVRSGDTKITFGTGAMLDLVTDGTRPVAGTRGAAGCFPIVAWEIGATTTWALEGAMLAAGTNVTWLRDLGVIASVTDADMVAGSCADSGGVWFVPAPLGLGTPYWDFGARATFVGVTQGAHKPQIVRAVLEGVAQRGADLVEAAEADASATIDVVRVDGGMARSTVFVQAFADALARPVHVHRDVEATTVGAGLLGALGAGLSSDLDEAVATIEPGRVVDPAGPGNRERWKDAVERARGWIPELSAVEL